MKLITPSLLVLLFVACGPSQEDLDAANARTASLQAQLEQEQKERSEIDARRAAIAQQNAELIERLRALGENVEALEGERSNLKSTLDETQRALEELRERERKAQARLATFQSLVDKFKGMIESGRLRVRIVRNRMVVELPEGILFDSGRAELKEDGQATLKEVVAVLKDIPKREFQIAGHTDNIPIRSKRLFASNWELSSTRALTVTHFMITEGVPTNRISAAGYAATQPVAANKTREGRAQNRRIEIVLVPNLDELPDLSSLQVN